MVRSIQVSLLLLLSFVSLQAQELTWPEKRYKYFYIQNQDSSFNQNCSDKSSIHMSVLSNINGVEYYCSGTRQAMGPLKLLKSREFKYSNSDELIRNQQFERTGTWNLYFDSTSILKATGSFKNGVKNGIWTLYRSDESVRSEIIFHKNQIKEQIEYKLDGTVETIIDRENQTIFVLNNQEWLIWIAMIPILLIRMSWNIITYNKIHNTNFIPGFQDWQKEGTYVNLPAMLIFWWMFTDEDTNEIRIFKRIANWISVFSILFFVGIMSLILIYGES